MSGRERNHPPGVAAPAGGKDLHQGDEIEENDSSGLDPVARNGLAKARAALGGAGKRRQKSTLRVDHLSAFIENRRRVAACHCQAVVA